MLVMFLQMLAPALIGLGLVDHFRRPMAPPQT
jgi:hypothetical protein